MHPIQLKSFTQHARNQLYSLYSPQTFFYIKHDSTQRFFSGTIFLLSKPELKIKIFRKYIKRARNQSTPSLVPALHPPCLGAQVPFLVP
jgi:hypothetical protein